MTVQNAFFDTNVLLSLLSGDEAKSDRAEHLIGQGGVISVQVLNEFAAVASRKLALTWPDIREILSAVRSVCRIEAITVETHDRGVAVADRYGFTMYDSLIVSAALLAGCTVLYTEDIQDGQIIDGITVRNPFMSG